MINIERLPIFSRDAQVIIAVVRLQIFARNFEPLLRLVNARYLLRVDMQT